MLPHTERGLDSLSFIIPRRTCFEDLDLLLSRFHEKCVFSVKPIDCNLHHSANNVDTYVDANDYIIPRLCSTYNTSNYTCLGHRVDSVAIPVVLIVLEFHTLMSS